MKGRTLAAPFLLGVLVLVALPALAAVAISFTEYSGIGPPRFAGAENFTRMLGDEALWRSLGNTLIYLAMSLPLRIVLIFALASLLHRRFRGSSASRAAVYLPSVVPDAAYSLLWLWILNPIYGPAAAILGSLNPDWLTDPWSARAAIAIMGVFQLGEGFVVALAARRSIPGHIYEAAQLDGASAWFTMKRLTLPIMAPILAVLALRDLLLSFQANFVPALLLTDGGPRNATTYLPVFAYRQAFRYFRLGYASAISVTMLLVTAAVLLIQFRVWRRWRAKNLGGTGWI